MQVWSNNEAIEQYRNLLNGKEEVREPDRWPRRRALCQAVCVRASWMRQHACCPIKTCGRPGNELTNRRAHLRSALFSLSGLGFRPKTLNPEA
jgi:hypothetical protein